MTPQVFFLLNAPDPTAQTCRVVQQLLKRGHTVAIQAVTEQLEAIDRALWTGNPHRFLPHCYSDAPPQIRRYSPVQLYADAQPVPQADVLVHLGPHAAPGWTGFTRIIEIVGDEPQALAEARELWRLYVRSNCQPSHRDLAQPGGGEHA